MLLSDAAFDLVRLFDGQKTLAALQKEADVLFGGEMVPLDVIGNLVAGLDQEFFLEGPRLLSRLTTPDRPPACVGLLRRRPGEGRRQLRRLFTAAGGPGCPASPGAGWRPTGRSGPVLLPHMDYARGGVTYGWGFKELVERTDAALFVIVATSHYRTHRFTLTRKNFTTPLGRGRDRPGLHRPARPALRRRACSTTRAPTSRSTRSSWRSSCCSTCTSGAAVPHRAAGGRLVPRLRRHADPAGASSADVGPDGDGAARGRGGGRRSRSATSSAATWPTSARSSTTRTRCDEPLLGTASRRTTC